MEGHPEGSESVRAAGDHVPAREGGGRDHGHLIQEGAHRRQGSGLHRLINYIEEKKVCVSEKLLQDIFSGNVFSSAPRLLS